MAEKLLDVSSGRLRPNPEMVGGTCGVGPSQVPAVLDKGRLHYEGELNISAIIDGAFNKVISATTPQEEGFCLVSQNQEVASELFDFCQKAAFQQALSKHHLF